MAKKSNMLGSWAFLIGVILAVIFGAIGSVGSTMTFVLVVIGLIVGILNIADEETKPFLLSGLVLIVASAFGQGVMASIPMLSGILDALLLIFVPATVIVSIRHVFSLARR